MGKKDKKTLTEEGKSPEETSPTENEKENLYVFDSKLKNIFQSGSSATFTLNSTYDSNKEDELQDERNRNKDDKPKTRGRTIEQNPKEPMRKVHSWKEHFFFVSNDPRLSEGLAFFSSSKKQGSQAFSDLRKNLKLLVRHKISKNKSLKIKRKFGRKKWGKKRNVKVK